MLNFSFSIIIIIITNWKIEWLNFLFLVQKCLYSYLSHKLTFASSAKVEDFDLIRLIMNYEWEIAFKWTHKFCPIWQMFQN